MLLLLAACCCKVLTTNPLVESWGHFPAARRRLLALLEKYRPAGLLLLSGDVHYSEVSQPPPVPVPEPEPELDLSQQGQQAGDEGGQDGPGGGWSGQRLLEVTVGQAAAAQQLRITAWTRQAHVCLCSNNRFCRDHLPSEIK